MSRDAGKATSSLGLIDFDLLRVIGRGSYAKVLLVRLKKTDRIYAMKVVKKELVNDDEVRGLISYCHSLADSRSSTQEHFLLILKHYTRTLLTCTNARTLLANINATLLTNANARTLAGTLIEIHKANES